MYPKIAFKGALRVTLKVTVKDNRKLPSKYPQSYSRVNLKITPKVAPKDTPINTLKGTLSYPESCAKIAMPRKTQNVALLAHAQKCNLCRSCAIADSETAT